jgi:epoxyqueuosine reductase QueG
LRSTCAHVQTMPVCTSTPATRGTTDCGTCWRCRACLTRCPGSRLSTPYIWPRPSDRRPRNAETASGQAGSPTAS